MSDLLDFAERELQLLENGDEYDRMTSRAVRELLEVFDRQNHSGMSAHAVLTLFNRVARYKPLAPLRDDPDEWIEVTDNLWHHKRDPSVFKDARGPYILNGIVWHDESGLWTDKYSCQRIKMPYLPPSDPAVIWVGSGIKGWIGRLVRTIRMVLMNMSDRMGWPYW